MNPINMPTEETLLRIAEATERMAKGSIFLPRLSVTTPIGVDITVTDGLTTFQKRATTHITNFDIPNFGIWTANFMVGPYPQSATIEIDAVKIYPVSPRARDFQDVSWTEVIALINLGYVPDSWEIGDKKRITLRNGDSINTEIIGKNRESIVGGGTASLVFDFVDCYKVRAMNYNKSSNFGGWGGTNIRDYCNHVFFDQFPDDLKKVIKKVTKKTSRGNGYAEISTTEDYLWLLSATEVFPNVNKQHSPGGEGELFPIFTDNVSRIKRLNDKRHSWFLRSPFPEDSEHYDYITDYGNISYGEATRDLGVVVGFCL